MARKPLAPQRRRRRRHEAAVIGEAGHAVEVHLVGPASNREAIGARVDLWSGGQRQCGAVRRGGGFMGASDSALHFGLGRETTVARVVVRWPDGTTSEHRDLAADARFVIRQSDATVKREPFLTSASTPSRVP